MTPRGIARAALATCTAGVLLVAPARVRSAPAESSEVTDASVRAEFLYNAGRYVEAARLFADLEVESVGYLYFAGIAYEAAGHDASAIRQWQRALASDRLVAELRKRAQARLDDAKARTTLLRARATPVAGASAELYYQGGGGRQTQTLTAAELAAGVYVEDGTWVITVFSDRAEYLHGTTIVKTAINDTAEVSVDVVMAPIVESVTLTFPSRAVAAGVRMQLRDEAGIEPEVHVAPDSEEYSLELRRGRWSYRAEAPGHRPGTGEIFVGTDGPREFLVPLEWSRPAPSPGRPLAITTGTVGMLLAAAGGMTIALGKQIAEERCRSGIDYRVICVGRPLEAMEWGTVTLGAGAGLLVTSVTAAVPRKKARVALWSAELAAGATLSALGGMQSWNNDRWQGHVDRFNAAEESEHFKRVPREPELEYQRGNRPYWVMFGVGAALVAGSITGLALERLRSHESRRHARGPRLRSVLPLSFDF